MKIRHNEPALQNTTTEALLYPELAQVAISTLRLLTIMCVSSSSLVITVIAMRNMDL